jgi:hypothetical protein
MWNGAGFFLMFGGDAQMIGQKTANIFNTLNPTTIIPTMAPMTMFGFRHMLCHGQFTNPITGVSRSLMLSWNGEYWTAYSQNLNLTQIGSYEDNSIITPYGTDGTSLYRLFAQPSNTLLKICSTKSLRGDGQNALMLKNFKRLFCEVTDVSTNNAGVNIVGVSSTGFGGVPGGVQDISFELAGGAINDILPQPLNGQGIAIAVDLTTFSPDFIIERLYFAAELRTLYGA